MFEGYLELGGNEILNAARAWGYASSADCPISWFTEPDCPNFNQAIFDDEYDIVNIAQAPWYDPTIPETARFYGAYPITISGIEDSTRTASTLEFTDAGGVVSSNRMASGQVRCTAFLLARGRDALAAGLSWLKAALEPDSCSSHGASCGEQDIAFFVACPGAWDQVNETWDQYQTRVEGSVRHMHSVTLISGPIITDQFHRNAGDGDMGDPVGYMVEFTLHVGSPFVYSTPQTVATVGTTSSIIQDVIYNLIPEPSAELSSGTAIVATNYATNPSVETGTTGYGAFWNVNIPAAMQSITQTTELSANRTASFRGRVLGNNGTTVITNLTSDMQLYYLLVLPTGMPANTRYSISMWGAALISGGASGSSLTNMIGHAMWENSSNTLIRDDVFQTVTGSGLNGSVYYGKSLLPPVGATQVRVALHPNFVFSSSSTPANNSDLRFYMDAVLISVP